MFYWDCCALLKNYLFYLISGERNGIFLNVFGEKLLLKVMRMKTIVGKEELTAANQ